MEVTNNGQQQDTEERDRKNCFFFWAAFYVCTKTMKVRQHNLSVYMDKKTMVPKGVAPLVQHLADKHNKK